MAGSLLEAVSRLRRSPERLRSEIDELTRANRESPEAERERELVRRRNASFTKLRGRPPSDAPEMAASVDAVAASYDVVDGIPELSSAELNAETIRSAFLGHGCLLVRGLLDAAPIADLTAGIDRALAERDAYVEGAGAEQTTPWFEPFEPERGYSTEGADWNRIKEGSGAVWACDSPRMLFKLLEAFEDAGIVSIAADYLGERPAFSMNKAVLRRTPPDTLGAWHQDGAFLGGGIRTLNVWLALSDCGERAPSLDVVPRRFESVLETGIEGAAFPWSVSNSVAEELLEGKAAPRPVFEPGDALLFDHLCLHRTGTAAGMDQVRYATETWNFASSSFPNELVPIAV